MLSLKRTPFRPPHAGAAPCRWGQHAGTWPAVSAGFGALALLGGLSCSASQQPVRSATAEDSAANDSTAEDSAANDSTAEDSTANDSTAEDPTGNDSAGHAASVPDTAAAQQTPGAPRAASAITPRDRDAGVQTPSLPSGTTVLHIGDSFAGALGYELNKELSAHGVKGIIQYEKSTYIPTWAWKKDVATYLWKYKPDLILITLGGNELGIANPEQRAKTIQRLVQRLDGIPCVWVGIPLWEGANPALMEVIEQNSSPCLFLDSHALLPDLERAKDKIHPSVSARKRWAQTVVDWLRARRRTDGDEPWAWKERQ